MIGEVDKAVQRALVALEAKRIMRLGNFDLYRLDRATALAIAARRVPETLHIDFGSLTAARHELYGWGPPHLVDPPGVGASAIDGYSTCTAPERDPERANRCKTVLTSMGLEVKDARRVPRAKLLIRIPQSCDLGVRVELARPTQISLEMNGFTARQTLMSRTASFTVPASAVRPGVNEITLENLLPLLGAAQVQSLDVAPACR
jgi:hypothetical protein